MNQLITFCCLDGKFNYIISDGDSLSKTSYAANLKDFFCDNVITISEMKYNVYIITIDFEMDRLKKYLYGQFNINLFDVFLYFMDERTEDMIENYIDDIMNNKYSKMTPKIMNTFPTQMDSTLKFYSYAYNNKTEMIDKKIVTHDSVYNDEYIRYPYSVHDGTQIILD